MLAAAQVEPASTVENQTVENQQVEDPPTMKFTWTIENFSRLNTKKHYSDVFVVGGYKWYFSVLSMMYSKLDFNLCLLVIGILTCLGAVLFRRILIFPKGNNVDYLSMYLDVADSGTLPYGWSRYAQFSLGVVNQIHNKFSIRKGIFSLPLLPYHVKSCVFCSLVIFYRIFQVYLCT